MVEAGITPYICEFVMYGQGAEEDSSVYSDAILVVGY